MGSRSARSQLVDGAARPVPSRLSAEGGTHRLADRGRAVVLGIARFAVTLARTTGERCSSPPGRVVLSAAAAAAAGLGIGLDAAWLVLAALVLPATALAGRDRGQVIGRLQRARAGIARPAVTLARTTGERCSSPPGRVVLSLVAAVVVGLGIGLDAAWLVLAALVPAATALGIRDWRLSILGLLLFLPISGLASLGFQDDSAPLVKRALPSLLKDLLFVLPAYIGFALELHRRRRLPVVPRALLVALAAFGAIVLLQALRTGAGAPAVTLVGVKVWLFYLPLVLLGATLVRDLRELHRVLWILVASAALPVVVGLVEAALVISGHRMTVYEFYGATAQAATQDFVGVPVGLGDRLLYRLPSTFTFFVQYSAFLIAMVGIGWGWWRGPLRGRRGGWLGAVVLAAVVLAAVTSGARNAFLAVPFVLAAAFLLEYRGRSGGVRRLVPVVGAGLAALAIVAGVGAGPLRAIADHAVPAVNEQLVEGFDALSRPGGLAGQGPGLNTTAAINADALLDSAYIDSWLVKAAVELGIAGLIALLALLAIVAWHVVRAHHRVRHPLVIPISAGLTALILWTLANTVKGFYLDLDPLAVFFWLFVGVVLALPRLRTET